MAEITVERNDVVMGPGGVEAGRVEHVIVNELSQQITDLVVFRKDGTEFMVPIGNVVQQGPGVFMLRTPPERLEGAHLFEPGRYHALPEEAIHAAPDTAAVADNTVIHASHDAVIAVEGHGAAPVVPVMSARTATPATPPMPSLSAHPPAGHAAGQSEAPRPLSPSVAPVAPVVPQETSAPDTLREQITGAVQEQVATTKAQVTDAVHDTVETVKSSVRGATADKAAPVAHTTSGTARGAGNSLIETVRANPVPVALMGLGIGWLLRQHSGGSGSGGASPAMGRETRPVPVASFADDEEPDQTPRRAGAGSSALGTLGEAASTASSSVGQFVGQAGEGVGNLAGAAGDRVSDLTASMGQGARGAQSRVAYTLHENPMNIGIVALALGFAAGFLLPETPVENQLFGDTRDALLGQAQVQITKAQRVAEDMQKVVHDLQDAIPQTVKKSAQRQGLTGQS